MKTKADNKRVTRLGAVVMIPLVLGVVLGLGFGALIPSVAFAATPAVLMHDYQLNNSTADALGGPALVLPVPSGLRDTGYEFDIGKGPNLSNADIDPTSYSIEMRFWIDSVGGYQKLIDFKNRDIDAGHYVYYGFIYFYDPVSGSKMGSYATIIPGLPVHMVLTRNGETGEFIVYVYGVQQVAFTDYQGLAEFNGPENPDNMIYFLRDNSNSPAENPSGFLDYVRIYDGVLTPEQVQAHFEVGNSSPEPPTPLGLFTVYDVKPKAFAGGSGHHGDELNIEVEFEDPLGTSEKTLKTVKKAKRILVPLDQNGEETADAGTHLVCYDFKKPKPEHKGKKGKDEELGVEVRVSNPLYDGFIDDDGQDVEIKKLKMICVPSEIIYEIY